MREWERGPQVLVMGHHSGSTDNHHLQAGQGIAGGRLRGQTAAGPFSVPSFLKVPPGVSCEVSIQ